MSGDEMIADPSTEVLSRDPFGGADLQRFRVQLWPTSVRGQRTEQHRRFPPNAGARLGTGMEESGCSHIWLVAW